MEELLLMETEKGISGVCLLWCWGEEEHTREPGKNGNWQKKSS